MSSSPLATHPAASRPGIGKCVCTRPRLRLKLSQAPVAAVPGCPRIRNRLHPRLRPTSPEPHRLRFKLHERAGSPRVRARLRRSAIMHAQTSPSRVELLATRNVCKDVSARDAREHVRIHARSRVESLAIYNTCRHACMRAWRVEFLSIGGTCGYVCISARTAS